MKKIVKRAAETHAGKQKAKVPIAFLALLMIAVGCNEDSAESAAEGMAQDEIHRNLPADPRTEATAEDPSAPWEGTSGIAPHEHEPKHGGVVRSVDVYHVELTENPMQVWLYDRRGQRFPVDGLEGQIVVYSGDQRHPYTLQLRGDHLVPVEPVDLPDQGSAFVELTLDKQSIDVAYELPLGAGDAS